MPAGMKIKDVSDASGFTAATLRYYSDIGLLPEASRTPAGYRMYDQRTLDRLAFIARAKQLGCSLDEITGLTTAWDGGQCGPIQDQLRQLVAAKITAAQNQIAELATFTAQLQQAATAVERHRPDGACDSECGCVSEPSDTNPAAAHDPHRQPVGRTDGGRRARDRLHPVGWVAQGPDGGLAGVARLCRAPRGGRRWHPIGVRSHRCRSTT